MSSLNSKNRLNHILNHLNTNSTASKIQSKYTFALVTGANRGVGIGLVRFLLTKRANYFVIATARNPSKATELQALINRFPGRGALIQLDVSSEQSVNESVNKVTQITNKLDILINNAGTP